MSTPDQNDDDLMKLVAARAESSWTNGNLSSSNIDDDSESQSYTPSQAANCTISPSTSNANSNANLEYCDKEHQLEIQDLRERAEARNMKEAGKACAVAGREDDPEDEKLAAELMLEETMLEEKKKVKLEPAYGEKRQKGEISSETEANSESPVAFVTAASDGSTASGSPERQVVPDIDDDMGPGAWAVSGYRTNRSGDQASDDETYDVEANTTVPVAILAEDDANLPEAQQDFDHSVQHFKTKQLKKRLAIAAFFLPTVALVIVISLVLALGSGSSSDEKTMAPQINISDEAQAPIDLDEHVKNLLPEESIRAMAQIDSPQAKAFQWIVEDQNLLMLSDDRILQRYALATLYHATNGDEWALNDYWLNHNVHECQWFGKDVFAMKNMVAKFYPGYLSEFFPPTEAPPVNCNVNGHYLNLWLDKNNLVGYLPQELYLLTTLKTLSVGFNQLKRGISSQIGLLTSLEGASFAKMQDAGEIPSELGVLTNLKGLSLSTSNHQGSIPSELWQLTNMQTLALSFNKDLRGSLPTKIASMSKLKMFAIADTSLTGSIPTEMGLLQDTLEWIALGGNSLTGPIPSEFGLLTNMLLLSAYENMLSGSIPTELGELTLFQYFIALRGNMLSGPIPSELGRLTSLKLSLNLHDNKLSGAIPTELGRLGALQDFSVDNNVISGHIPSELGLLTLSLGMLGLANNTLSGTIPQEMSFLEPLLHTLRLEGNAFLSGVVPDELCQLNATCTGHSLYPCQGPYGMTFDCSDLLCGCGCSCAAAGRL
ncbi:Leucine Rich Repeat [Seminavis robusta]|uniref:Leucine Rich Repeat n=1 Tax=Seminavis robusta TaxID=568900 RepID=A0A9N8DBM3_9STRA|nr:Leucine Rich Repeat [Seminavis robusta]|eukprot:Sro74_g040710.1 Leucine Rich Repeat (772) ;mRNA; r:43594-46130